MKFPTTCFIILLFPLLPTLIHCWLPGVNLGGLFIIESRMMQDAWNRTGCADKKSEFDCVLKLGQPAANAISSPGPNTIRIPLGYWMLEALVYKDSGHFPQGGFPYPVKVCEWAKNAGIYRSKPSQNSSRQAPASMHQDFQYERAYKLLEWMIKNRAHEPIPVQEQPDTKVPSHRILAVEKSLNVDAGKYLHIQMMNEKWGGGNPNASLEELYYAFYGDHHCVKWTPNVPVSKDGYMRHSCTNSRAGNWQVVVGEWSLSVNDKAEWGAEFGLESPGAKEWYRGWCAAQVVSYEKNEGWVFWNWKVDWIGGRNDWRWGYKSAVEAGVIPKDPGEAYKMGACAGFDNVNTLR
ncbi:glycoside hydrolase [Choiromyces venosus 120613-1]|uniref:glucan 1,3-beta-glucosidase n=1 Tax=Choiromyces venosus 120613-1 TaxID=1336337 RepID=A0A3N4J4W3_9PEZI|nr:glycoside hydrolase [Choiromyces venosus 120613-1]